MPISILILTLNEEPNIGACLDALKGFDDIVVFDSLSTDRTREIALAKGARVVERPFDNWAAHQNWALDNIEFKHPWVFYLDADERMTPELRDEIMAVPHILERDEQVTGLQGAGVDRHALRLPVARHAAARRGGSLGCGPERIGHRITPSKAATAMLACSTSSKG